MAENLIPAIEVALMLAHTKSIHIAAGALMALHHLSEDEAIATLKSAGATDRRMARDTAQSVLDALER
jgi:AmiR/NasT family two-component response regulator